MIGQKPPLLRGPLLISSSSSSSSSQFPCLLLTFFFLSVLLKTFLLFHGGREVFLRVWKDFFFSFPLFLRTHNRTQWSKTWLPNKYIRLLYCSGRERWIRGEKWNPLHLFSFPRPLQYAVGENQHTHTQCSSFSSARGGDGASDRDVVDGEKRWDEGRGMRMRKEPIQFEAKWAEFSSSIPHSITCE